MPKGEEIKIPEKRPTVCRTCDGRGYTRTLVHGGRFIWKRERPTCKGKGVAEGEGG